jgi:hypothetical protein
VNGYPHFYSRDEKFLFFRMDCWLLLLVELVGGVMKDSLISTVIGFPTPFFGVTWDSIENRKG